MPSRPRTRLRIRACLDRSRDPPSPRSSRGYGAISKREAGANRTVRGGALPCPFRFLLRFKNERIWNAGKTLGRNLRTFYRAAPSPEREGTARLAAFHHGSCQGVCGPLVRSGPGFVGRAIKGRGSLRRRSPHFQRRTPHPSHNAGRHDARTAREQVASLPAGSAPRPTAAVCRRDGVLSSGEMIRGHM